MNAISTMILLLDMMIIILNTKMLLHLYNVSINLFSFFVLFLLIILIYLIINYQTINFLTTKKSQNFE